MIVNVDADGVIYDWHGWTADFFSAETGVKVTRDDWAGGMQAKLGVDNRRWEQLFDHAVAHGCFLHGEAIPGTIAGLEALIDAGHHVRIVTHKIIRAGNFPTFKAETDFLFWFSQFGLLDKVDIVFTGERFGKNNYPADVIVDDKSDLSWVQGARADELRPVNILFDQPWNQHLSNIARIGDDPNYENPIIYRAIGWRDVLELVEQMGGGILIDKSPTVV